MIKHLKKNLYAKYVIIAIISFIIDILLFSVFDNLLTRKFTYSIIISSYLARFISSLLNYYLNKYIVFKYIKTNTKDKTLYKYLILVVLNISISALAVELLHILVPLYAVVIKIIIDSLIFVINFLIQKHWVFK